MRFSTTSNFFVGELNELALAYQARRAEDKEVMELCSTLSGFAAAPAFPFKALRSQWEEGLKRAKNYEPDPMGALPAREAIAAFYQRRGLKTDPNHVLLTCGSSLSYLYLFRMLADPGEEVLCPTPSYPLFHYIAKMAGVRIAYYPLEERADAPFWELSWEQLENCVSTRTKAIVLISPHNPTGHVIDQKVWEKIAGIALRFEIPLIHDEVFSEFLWQGNDAILPRAAKSTGPLVFTLNGLSKIFALPGMKLGWILIHGEKALVDKARERLEMISDTFLPANEPVQQALPAILGKGEGYVKELSTWIKARLDQSTKLLQKSKHLTILSPAAGFYLILRLNEGLPNADQLAVELLNSTGVLVHPGSFYEMKGNHLVFSFLHDETLLNRALPALVAFIDRCAKR